MWKWTHKDQDRPSPMRRPVPSLRIIPSEESLEAVLGLQSVESSDPDVTRIGKSVVIKGDISGGGSLYLDGELEGNVELNGSLTIGPEGRVRGNFLRAHSIVVRGRVEGDLYGLEHTKLKKSATVVGDIYTPRIAIEDGTSLTGSVHANKDISRPQTKKTPQREVA